MPEFYEQLLNVSPDEVRGFLAGIVCTCVLFVVALGTIRLMFGPRTSVYYLEDLKARMKLLQYSVDKMEAKTWQPRPTAIKKRPEMTTKLPVMSEKGAPPTRPIPRQKD